MKKGSKYLIAVLWTILSLTLYAQDKISLPDYSKWKVSPLFTSNIDRTGRLILGSRLYEKLNTTDKEGGMIEITYMNNDPIILHYSSESRPYDGWFFYINNSWTPIEKRDIGKSYVDNRITHQYTTNQAELDSAAKEVQRKLCLYNVPDWPDLCPAVR